MKEFTAITRALADENRARILMLLDGGELCVCQILEMFALAPSTISKHLAILCQAGLVEYRKAGRWIYYRLPRHRSARAGEAIRFVRKCLAGSPQAANDAKRLAAVRRMSMKTLCRRYRN
ncbi:MAG: winged helix-turn-helix transcriptional regulator [Planctomycetes bacterium]|nr:winged helix-turn-helix transcriptional regulator [Planctomycetota bacterium]